jgi:hypothetical protein
VEGLPNGITSMDMGQGPGDLHAMDFSLVWFNVEHNAAIRLSEYQKFNS